MEMGFQPHATTPLPQGEVLLLLNSIGDWMGLRVSLEVSEKRKKLLPRRVRVLCALVWIPIGD